MDKIMNKITLKSVIKFIFAWMLITVILLLLYTYFTSNKTTYRKVLVANFKYINLFMNN